MNTLNDNDSDNLEISNQPASNSDQGSEPHTRASGFRWLVRFRLPILILAHTVVFCAVYYLAIVIRFERWIPTDPRFLWIGMPFVASIKLALFYVMRNFHGWWRYVTFSDLYSLARAATMSVFVIVLVDHFVMTGFQIPRTVVAVDWAFTIAVLCALRSVLRFWDENVPGFSQTKKSRNRALLIGGDASSAQLAHLINSRAELNIRIVGLVSLEKANQTRFSDLRVVGHAGEIKLLCTKHHAKTVYVPSGKLNGNLLRKLVELSTQHDFQVNVIPQLGNLLQGGSEVPIRNVEYEDLLKRAPVNLETELIESMVEGKVILVTGAGGSIGSEICRQLLRFGPAKLVLAGRGENRIFHVTNELRRLDLPGELATSLVNVVDRQRVEQVFEKHQPDVVFHAAAHKHVPLTENNIGEAVINNIQGTKVVADVAHEFNVENFVLVSTDKAVHPTSIMGCTKQLAERYCLVMDQISKTKFVVTRFGNVLGSEGSVIPLFQEQIRRGGPITVTDPRMERYFMTIPEASQLVLQAAAMGKGGEIFVLEMGEPVKIVDLARDLIRLAGLSADSIEIEFSGVRPGEKLFEELYYGDEDPLPTRHNQILIAYCRVFDFDEVQKQISNIVEMAFEDDELIRKKIKELIPEYRRNSSESIAEPPETDSIQVNR